ncbi:DsrE/DsrF/DrsH-like family protein [Chloroflexota bacterium]
MSEELEIMCNHSDADSVMAALIMGAAAAATGDEVLMFFQPGGAKVLVKGELEKFKDLPGMPDPMYLYDSITTLDGRWILCELGIPNKGINPDDLREEVEVRMASDFLFDAEGATKYFSY